MSSRPLLVAAVLASSALAPRALAQECASAADCPAGYTCTAYEQSCPSCPPDVVCDPCEPGTPVSFCEIVPTVCATDDDCEAGLVCVHFTGESCPGAAPCRVDDESCTGEPPPCETVDESYCAPPYVAPCAADADCGPGFTCETAEVCGCVVYPDPGNGEPPPPEECTCEATGETYCALTYQECASDAECPEGLVCTEGGAADAAPCFIDENGVETCPGGGDPVSFCAPAGYVTPLPLEGDGVTAERASEASGEGEGEGEGDGGGLCASRQTGGPAPSGALVVLVLLPMMLRTRRAPSHRTGAHRPARHGSDTLRG